MLTADATNAYDILSLGSEVAIKSVLFLCFTQFVCVCYLEKKLYNVSTK